MGYLGTDLDDMGEAIAALRKRVGANLTSLRELRGLSVADAAKHVGKNAQTIYNYEAGTTGIPYEIAWSLCELYGVNIGVLGGRVDYEPVADATA